MTEPLVPANVDLRDFPYMPLDVVRLRDSRIVSHSSGEGFRCAVLLWCASWHQVPAGSLPDDDVQLAQYAGFGRSLKEWRKHRDEALHGWVQADDGRWYHPVVSEKALEAWEQRLQQRWRTELARIKKAAQRNNVHPVYPSFEQWEAHYQATASEQWRPEVVPGDMSPLSSGTQGACPDPVPRETASKGREGKGRDLQATAGTPREHGDSPRAPTTAGLACAAMHRAGLASVNPQHPRLLEAIAAGVTPAELEATAREAVAHNPPKGFAWAIATALGRRNDAANGASHVPSNSTRPRSAVERVRANVTAAEQRDRAAAADGDAHALDADG